MATRIYRCSETIFFGVASKYYGWHLSCSDTSFSGNYFTDKKSRNAYFKKALRVVRQFLPTIERDEAEQLIAAVFISQMEGDTAAGFAADNYRRFLLQDEILTADQRTELCEHLNAIDF